MLQHQIESRRDPFVVATLVNIQQWTNTGYLPTEIGRDLFQRYAATYMETMDTAAYVSEKADVAPPSKFRYFPNQEPREPNHGQPPMPWMMLFEFVESLLKDKAYEALATRFFEKLSTQIAHIPASEYPGLWLPFLRRFSGLLQGHNILLDTAKYRIIFAQVLCAWLNTYVGRQPRPNTSLVRPRVKCSCGDCNDLSRFLLDGSAEVGRFPRAEKRRRHMQMELCCAEMDIECVTESFGSPYTLVVKKTNHHDQLAKSAWQQRVTTAKTELGQFNQNDLRAILGPRLYPLVTKGESVMDSEAMFSTIETGNHEPPSNALLPVAGNANGTLSTNATVSPALKMPLSTGNLLPQVIGAKRPAPGAENIVDLAGDSD